ncbi:MAG: SDR family oxidoreductase [Kordiimonadaceae bacterium]|nr:SDR family oxidoreductase [Kordiimonadaceae bacterium]
MNEPYILNLLTSGFKDAVVVVIGGKGGIGSQVVKQAKELGATVIVGSRTATKPDTSDAVIADAYIPIDICDTASIQKFAATLQEKYGRIDILVNTAGLSYQIPPNNLELLTDEMLTEVLDTNAKAPLVIMRELAGLLQAGQDPVIVNLSSIAAHTGGGSNLAYAASKAALDTASKAIARALAPKVRVVNISPSALDTDFVRNRNSGFIDATIKASALKRLASTTEVATAVLCAARLLTATTGTNIFVDAGRHL